MITVCGLLLMSWVMKTITDMSEASLSIQLIIPLLKYVLYAVFFSIFITIFTSVTLLHCATVTLPQTHHHAWGKRSRFYMLGRLPKLKKSSF